MSHLPSSHIPVFGVFFPIKHNNLKVEAFTSLNTLLTAQFLQCNLFWSLAWKDFHHQLLTKCFSFLSCCAEMCLPTSSIQLILPQSPGFPTTSDISNDFNLCWTFLFYLPLYWVLFQSGSSLLLYKLFLISLIYIIISHRILLITQVVQESWMPGFRSLHLLLCFLFMRRYMLFNVFFFALVIL